ncbi:SPASM domain-containing protein [Chitinispirillales bacterium ANBcel5]|uniref:SPASM domain-containing protein n=1 Tax=Cellulosispirillum alkaliphilum TaxID=3039283 RepID=UPI002A54B4D6|nr:SPASM domain-containing protein [Chitinispirillales bacterium ANBcel5]
MAKFQGKALLPSKFVLSHILPALFQDIRTWSMLPRQLRKYLPSRDPNFDLPIGQISLRVNEICNLRCSSCGQWGENGHLRLKLNRGEKLNQLDFDVVKRIVFETRRDNPFYYIWGGEPTMWKPLLPFFQELAKYNLKGSLVTNAQDLDRILEDLIDTGSLSVLFLSLDGWDSQSQNVMRSPANGKVSNNFEKTIAVMEKADEIKRKKNLVFPMIVPITVISNHNYSHLADIHRLVLDKAQLHPYYYGWFITEERAKLHEKVFEERFGYPPQNHRGYLKSCFNDVDPAQTAKQIEEIHKMSKGRVCYPQFFPDIESEAQIRRYYSDHSWHCGYPRCESIYYACEISPDGRMTPCRDYQDYTVGNINNQPFYDVWNSEAFKTFRIQMKKGLMPVCTRCCGLQGF